MKLQVAFDTTDLTRAIAIAKEIAEFIDIVEIGNLLIYRHGVEAVHKFRQALPHHQILIDVKIVDRGTETVPIFAHAGANWLTIMAGTSKEVILRTCMEASKYNISMMLDLLDVNPPAQAALDAKNLGVQALLFHQPHDSQEPLELLDTWQMIRDNTQLPVFISAHINRANILNTTRLNPYGLIIGKAIIDTQDPRTEAEYFYALCKKNVIDPHIIE